MQKPLAFGELRPDVALLDSQFAGIADNVLPGIDHYNPLPGLSPINPNVSGLPSPCLGLYAARKSDGSFKIYAGTSTKLYIWGTGGWTDATRLVGGNYSVILGWTFAQFGTNLYACSGVSDVLQSIDIEAGVNFAAAAGSPPQARSVAVVGEFLVLCGLAANPRQIEWSALNNPAGWTIGVGLCDLQEFPDGGPVQGVSGSESVGYVLQDRMIRTMQFLPGDTTFIFSFTRSVKERGCTSPYGFTTVADILYYTATDGIYALANAQSLPIGEDKINDWFLANSDQSRANSTLCFQTGQIYIFWAFFSSGAAQFYDRLLIYNWARQRFATATVSAQAWCLGVTVGYDEETDFPGDANDSNIDSASPSMDSRLYSGGQPIIFAVDLQGRLCTLDGPALAATLETSEAHLAPGQRAFVSEVRPMIDSANCTVISGTRERLGDPVVYGAAVPLEVTGTASILNSSRLHRFQVRTPVGDTWGKAEGVIAEAQPDGYA